jgi:uncharacterized protein (PEP-CTERM system associated)
MDEQRLRRAASGVLLCAGIAAFVPAAHAQDAAPATGAAANATAGIGNGNGAGGAVETPGASGPLIASPSVLPATGIGAVGPDVRIGNLGNQVGGPPLQAAQRNWTLTPSIGLTEEYTTGAQAVGRGGAGGVGDQLISIIEPSIFATGDTPRLHGELSYAPQIMLYVPDGNQNQVSQNINARLLGTLVPQTLFLDVRGSGSVQPITAGQAPTQTTTLARGNSTQTYNFSATPYAVHRFGDWGTGEVGGTYALSTQTALQPATPGPVLTNLAAASNQNVTIESAHLAFVTGEAFYRYNGIGLAQASSFDGTGVLSGAYRDIVTLDSGYAITRTITALATVGWENIHYGGTDPVKIDDEVWNVGLRLVPNQGSTITIRYGHQDGLNSLTIDAGYQPTARTRIYARTSTGLTTSAELLQNALATSDLDDQGNPVDHTTGAPLVPTAGFFGTQNNLYKTVLTSVTGVLLLDRDTLSASVTSQDQTLVSSSNVVGETAGNSRGIYGTFTWSHLLSPNLQSTFYVQYGTTHNEGVPSTTHNEGVPSTTQQLAVVSVSLAYAFSPTLSGRAQYSFTDNWGGNQTVSQAIANGNQLNGAQNLFLISLIKSF